MIEPVRIAVTDSAIGPEKTRKTMKLKIDEGTQRKVSCDPNFSFPLIRPFWPSTLPISAHRETIFDRLL
mgnify:FL=1